MEFKYSFHSHTYRCGHAEGDVEDYVKECVKHGYSFLGVSDHVFLPNISQPRMRGDYSLLDEYLSCCKANKEKYKNKIQIFTAFECEYIEQYMDYYKSLLREDKVDYLLVGQHFTFDKDNNFVLYFNYSHPDNYQGIERYKNDLILAIRSGLFLYAAHPDLFMYTVTEITPFIGKIFNEIIDAAIECDIPLELNISGYNRYLDDIKNHTIGYPCREFWKLAKEKGAKIIYGGDYHIVSDVHNERNIQFLNKLIDELGLEFADPIEIYKEYRNRTEHKKD